MFIPPRKKKPRDLTGIKRLIVDRKTYKTDEDEVVCLDLDNTLFCIVNKSTFPQSNSIQTKFEWFERGIDVVFDEADTKNQYSILPRPGLTEFLIELRKYSGTSIYANLIEDHIYKIMNALSFSQGDINVDENYEAAAAYLYSYSWCIEQCIPTAKGYEKSLGHFSGHEDIPINKLWMITDKPELVDFQNRVVTVPSYYGDPEDRVLFQLIDELFVN